jgi:hypothetical protein
MPLVSWTGPHNKKRHQNALVLHQNSLNTSLVILNNISKSRKRRGPTMFMGRFIPVFVCLVVLGTGMLVDGVLLTT